MTDLYTADQITVLEWYEGVRKYPGMYLGSTGVKGLHCLVDEILLYLIEETDSRDLQVTVESDGTIAIDSIDLQVDRSKLFLMMVHLSRRWLYFAVANALSERSQLSIIQNGYRYTQSYSRGLPQTDLKEEYIADIEGLEEIERENSSKASLSLYFLPDREIFKDSIELDRRIILPRLQELAYLHAGCRLSWQDFGDARTETYYYALGLKEYFSSTHQYENPYYPEIFFITDERDGVKIAAVWQWYRDSEKSSILSYVNNLPTVSGTHVEGFQKALNNLNLPTKIQQGLRGIIALQMPDPEYAGSTRDILVNPKIVGIVDRLVSETLQKYRFDRPDIEDLS